MRPVALPLYALRAEARDLVGRVALSYRTSRTSRTSRTAQIECLHTYRAGEGQAAQIGGAPEPGREGWRTIAGERELGGSTEEGYVGTLPPRPRQGSVVMLSFWRERHPQGVLRSPPFTTS